MALPILYSLRHCPFAMRARLAIFKSKEAVELRDVELTNKPLAMLNASPKGTVPILVVAPSQIIDESLDVMLWILRKSDPDNLLSNLSDLLAFINVYDSEFKPCIERYKAAKRYHEPNVNDCREACEVHIQDLEKRLSEHAYIFGERESLADIAILPFIRQFAKVERQWYVQSSYVNVKRWLNAYLQSRMFNKVMAQYSVWEEGSEVVIFGGG
jgi:glutathione S-transferase